MRTQRQSGFTLIELVVAITLSTIVLSFVSIFITTPMHIYGQQTQRSALVDSADSALRLMTRDLRRALPNSVRHATSGNTEALELLLTTDAARYRDDDAASSNDDLDFGARDVRFSTIGRFAAAARNGANCVTPAPRYVSIYNVGVLGADAYEMANVITPAGMTVSVCTNAVGVDDVRLSNPGMQFAYGSPERRVYLLSGPVTFLCDKTARTIRRYAGYTIRAAQPTSPAAMTGVTSNSLIASNVDECSFTYSPDAHRSGLVKLDLTLKSTAASTERVRLLHQIHVENAP